MRASPITFILLTMFYAARSFTRSTTTASIRVAFGLSSRGGIATSRIYMSTGQNNADTSVVDTCTQKIRAALDAQDVKVVGAFDDPNGSHISVVVVSSEFEGKRPVQRQQMVYKAIWEELQGAVHAVDSMVCKTPAEAK